MTKTTKRTGMLHCVFVFLSASSAMANPGGTRAVDIDLHLRNPKNGMIETRQVPRALPEAVEAGTFQQAVDHFGQLPGQTFPQRYWVDSEFANHPSTAPVLFHLCGEADCTDGYFLNDNARAWAKSLGANLIYLEHRYYGKSLPFPDLSTEHLQFLRLNNVIEDFANFQSWASSSFGWKGPWISLGGSYSGTLSAVYRLKHPELVIGALASSAPMVAGIGEAVSGDDIAGEYASTDPNSSDGGRQWLYQACVDMGMWQAQGVSSNASLMIPSQSLCQELFPGSTYVDFQSFNQTYDTGVLVPGNPAASNILFTYGSEDVWTNLGLSASQNSNSKITILSISGAGHHDDLNPPDQGDSQDVIAARQEFLKLAESWIAASKSQ